MDTKEIQLESVKVIVPTSASDRMYDELKTIIGTKKLTRENVVVVLVSLMQIAAKYNDINGQQKKAMIIDALNRLIDDQATDTSNTTEMKLLVQLTLPSIIDTFVSIDKKKIQIELKKGCNKQSMCCGYTK